VDLAQTVRAVELKMVVTRRHFGDESATPRFSDGVQEGRRIYEQPRVGAGLPEARHALLPD
jgi:hypothetical protein